MILQDQNGLTPNQALVIVLAIRNSEKARHGRAFLTLKKPKERKFTGYIESSKFASRGTTGAKIE